MSKQENHSKMSIEVLIRNWEDRDLELWNNRPDYYLAAGKRALELGHPSLAYDILKQGFKVFEEDVEIGYYIGLALARGESTRSAGKHIETMLDKLSHDHPRFPDVLSLAGRIAKDRWSKLQHGSKRKSAAVASAEYYEKAFEISKDHFPGINAATMNMLAGRSSRSRDIAVRVRRFCLDELAASKTSDHWLMATLGEAHLLLGRQDESEDWYRKAAELAKGRYGDIATMKRQLMFLSQCIDIRESVLATLKVPRVVVFTGHMIDTPDRTVPRFPPELETHVKHDIIAALDRIDAGFGYSSAACGADILFIEAMIKREAEVHVLLPFRRDDFIETSVLPGGHSWVDRFEESLSGATSIHYATEERYLGDDVLFKYAGDLLRGTALIRSKQLQTDPVLLAVLETADETLPGGTAETVREWEDGGHRTEIIDLGKIREKMKGRLLRASEPSVGSRCLPAQSGALRAAGSDKPRPEISRQIKAMLFADVVGFSELGEEDTPSFFLRFLGQVASLIQESDPPPLFSNTWGDGLFLVFDDGDSAASFALRLRETVLSTDWERIGLPKETSIRIGMHAGPVFCALDPVIKRDNFFGSHVNQAARIEPVTAPGAVYMSEQCACLLEISGNQDFACDYLGAIDLAKQAGTRNLYRLRRVNETE